MRGSRPSLLPSLAVAASVIFACSFPAGLAAQQGGFQNDTGAQSGAQGGFSGPGIEPGTAAQALTMRDDTYVILRGNIVRSVGKDKYIFKDATGEITVDIDNHIWGGRNVTPQSNVEIYGEVDRDFMEPPEIDVTRLNVLN